MVGTLAQLISLVSYGNEYIIKGKLDTEYYPTNTTYQFCKQVIFKTTKEKFFGGEKNIDAGNDPLQWFRFLKQDGCLELKTFFQYTKQEEVKDYKLAGLTGGGGHWFIETIYKNSSDFWYAQWEVGDQNDPDRKIWMVQYKTALKKQEKQNIQLLLNPLKEKLVQKLVEIEDFARENATDFWADWFKKALTALVSETPYKDFYHGDMIVLKNYSLLAQQLIFGASKAWVFGAMGSWNDLGFDTKELNEKYERLTEELYDVVITALVGSVNSY